MPVSLTSAGGVGVKWLDDTLILTSNEAEYLAFYPGEECADLVDPLKDAESTNGRLALRFRPQKGHYGPARGILEVRTSGEVQPTFYELNLPGPGSGLPDAEVREEN